MKSWSKPELNDLNISETNTVQPRWYDPKKGACTNPAGAGNACPETWERGCKFYKPWSLDPCTGYGECTKKIPTVPVS